MLNRAFVFILLLSFGSLAWAEEATTTSTSTPNLNLSSSTSSTTVPEDFFDISDFEPDRPPEDPKMRAAALKQEQEARVKNQKALTDAKQQRIAKLASNMSYRMDAVVERYTNIIGRLEIRIEKMSQTGLDTAPATAELQKATATLAEAKSLLTTIDKLVYSAVTSPRPLSDWQIVKETYFKIAGLLRQTHENLHNAIILLKDARIIITNEPQSTSTPQSE